MLSDDRKPALFAADWGTSALRVWSLAATGEVLHTGSAEHSAVTVARGAGAGAGDDAAAARDDRFLALVADAIGPAFADHPTVPLVVCGMAGAREGWREAGYQQIPIALAEIGAGPTSFVAAGRSVHIFPGLAQASSDDTLPDVMRGEETQIVGLADEIAGADALVVLPGTHTKWVRVRAGRVAGFITAMTGELFAAVRSHTVVGRNLPADAGDATDLDAFDRGLRTARGDRGDSGLAAGIFSARTLELSGELPRESVTSYLSGVLIGDEVRHQLARSDASGPVLVYGSAALCRLYIRALRRAGADATAVDDAATVTGLFALAVRNDVIPFPAATERSIL